MSVEVICGKCGKKIATMKMLKSVKDVIRPYNNKCPECGQTLSTSEFTLDVRENWSKEHITIPSQILITPWSFRHGYGTEWGTRR